MKTNKKLGKFLNNVIGHWEESSVITSHEADKLRNSYEIISFDWRRLAKYSFWIALICIIISVFAAISAISGILEMMMKHPFMSCYIFTLISTILFVSGRERRKDKPEKVYSNEAILFSGVLSVAVSIAFLGKALDAGSGHFSLLILLATIIYGILGILFPSKSVWIFALLSFGSWMGTETGYVSGWGEYFLGMNYPLRFVLFGAALIGLSFLFKRALKLIDFFKSTYVLGFLYLFIALWILSIFGNYGSMDSWYRAKQIELFHWALIFGLVAIGSIIYGLKYDDSLAKGFGIVFLFINFYTRFFEHFWNATHKAIFFAILAVSFWLLGARAEKIWNLEFIRRIPD